MNDSLFSRWQFYGMCELSFWETVDNFSLRLRISCFFEIFHGLRAKFTNLLFNLFKILGECYLLGLEIVFHDDLVVFYDSAATLGIELGDNSCFG